LHSWCQITPFTQSCIMSSEILGPQMKMWPPHWPPQTAAARNAPSLSTVRSPWPWPYAEKSSKFSRACITKGRASAVKNFSNVTMNESTQVPKLDDNLFVRSIHPFLAPHKKVTRVVLHMLAVYGNSNLKNSHSMMNSEYPVYE